MKEKLFFFKEVHPGDLKNGVAEYLNQLMEPVRKHFESEEMKKLILNAYPPPAPVVQKKSKEKLEFIRFLNSFIFKEKPSGPKGQRPPATTTTEVSDLAEDVNENLVIENGSSTVPKTGDDKS